MLADYHYAYTIGYVRQDEKSLKQQNLLTSMIKVVEISIMSSKRLQLALIPYQNVSMAKQSLQI